MNSFSTKLSKGLWGWLIVIFAINGCTSSKPTLEELSQSYKQNHDYESLVSILPYLNFTMTRAEVEDLLGIPDSCFNSTSCLYITTKTVIAYCPTQNVVSQQSCSSHYIVLAVGYHLVDSINSSPQDVLWTFTLSPVGE